MDDQVGVDEAGATALTQFCILAKSTKGPACTSVISQALDHPSIFVFAELLDIPTVQELAGTSSEPYLELLKLFAYGTWQDYKGRAAQLPALSSAQAAKLKKLSVVTLSAQSRSIAYDALMKELEVSSVREIENLLIECFYGQLLQGKLDQAAGQLEVHHAFGRDIHPSEVTAMCEQLANWHQNSTELLVCVKDKLDSYKLQCDGARNEAADLEAKIEAVKSTLRAQHDAAEGGFGAMQGDFDGFDDDVDKTRKGGRTKGKHALGIGTRRGQ